MYVKRHEYFRWTPRTAWITLVYVGLIPAGFLYMGYRTEVCDGWSCAALVSLVVKPALIPRIRASTTCEAS